MDKTQKYRKFDKNVRHHVECKIVPIKKAGTKALANSQKAGE